MAKYLIIKNIEILKANANPAWYLVGPPALTAFHGFIQALLLTLVNEDINETKNIIQHEGFAVVHHDIQMLGSMNNFGNLFLPNKISSSHAYDKSDYVKEKVVLSSQPSATCNLLIDLIIKLPKEINEINKPKIEEFLHKGKIAGGKINVANKDVEPQIFTAENHSEILQYIKNGFYIVDRSDLLKAENEKTSLDMLLNKTKRLRDNKEKKDSWIVPNCVGYLCLTEFTNEFSSRNGYEVAYAEPVVTITQYCSVKSMKKIPFWAWECEVKINNKKLFLLKEKKNESN